MTHQSRDSACFPKHSGVENFMPIYLPPISRRVFLRRAVTAAAGLAISPKLLAAEKQVEENFWALFSDPHIAADRKLVHNKIQMAGHFEAVVREVAALPARPAGIFVNGDCAFDSGQKGDYATFARLLEPLRRSPVHLTLGNHDNRERFWDALAIEKAAKRPVADKQTLMVSAPMVNWFVLDSLDKTLSTPGVLGQPQLDWLAKTLDANANKPALVMLHHNPGLTEGVPGLTDTAALLEVLRPRKQVKAYFFGHTHFWNVTPDDSGIHFINLPPTGYVFKEGKPSGWLRATMAPDGMKLELRCVDTTHPQHGEMKELKWRA
jgi:3',5'-cyclic-AMP phosphodiesterase